MNEKKEKYCHQDKRDILYYLYMIKLNHKHDILYYFYMIKLHYTHDGKKSTLFTLKFTCEVKGSIFYVIIKQYNTENEYIRVYNDQYSDDQII